MRKDASALAAVFATAIGIRSIPELLSYPFLIGYDTILYAGTIQRVDSCLEILSLFPSPLLPLILCPFGKTFGPVVVMKIYPPIGYGLLAVGLYLFAESLELDSRESIVCVLFVLVQFTMLRISWDLHRNLLGLALLLVLLGQIRGPPRTWRPLLNAILAVLAILAHELTALLMVGILVVLAATEFGSRNRSILWNVIPSIAVGVSSLSFIAFANPELVSQVFGTYVQEDTVRMIPRFLLLLYLPTLPLALLGGRPNRVQLAWLLVAAAAALSPVLSPTALAFWDRWMLMMAAPLAFVAARGLLRFARFGFQSLQRLVRVPSRTDLQIRTVPVLMLVLLFLPSVYLAFGFMTFPSDRPFWYFDNPTLWHGGRSGIPSTMLSNTVALRDVPDIVYVISELDAMLEVRDVVLAHDAFYGWLLLYLDRGRSLLWFGDDPVQSTVALARAKGFDRIYLVWFVPNTGWHAPDPDLSIFRQILRRGIIAAYVYEE